MAAVSTDKPDEDEKKEPETVHKKSVQVLWDFDWSLINGNSDFYVHRKLYGKENYDKKIYAELDKEAESKGVTVFTDLMDQYCWPKLFNDFKLTKETFIKHLVDIDIFPSNLHIIRTLGADSESVQQFVISDANTVLIEEILNHHKLSPFIPSEQIYTNPGWWDEETGIIRCKRYHMDPHKCELKRPCSVNICKGKILTEEIFKKDKESDDLIRIYIGDGGGDYCPLRFLGENDYVFCRRGKSLERRIKKDDGIKLNCTVMKWSDGKELLQCFKSALPFAKL